ncbi:MAG: hypothetical protein ACTHM2_10260 [Afipia sp.]
MTAKTYDWRSPRLIWMGAFVLPFVMQLIAIPLERRYGNLLSGMSFAGHIAAYYGPIVLPSYVLLASMRATREAVLGNILLFSSLLLVLIPILYVFGMYAACYAFHWCI